MRKNYQSKEAGFTLIELIITLAVAIILMSVAVPSFNTAIKNNRLATQTNQLVSALNTARSEAVSRSAQVTMCRTSNGTSCNTSSGGWETGWLVFADTDEDGVLDSGETVIRVEAALDGGTTLRTGGNFSNYGSFLSRGESQGNTGLGNDTFRLCDDRGTASAYSITLIATGRVTSSRTTSSCP